MTQEWREELQISSKQRKKVLHVLLDLLLIHANCISMRLYDILYNIHRRNTSLTQTHTNTLYFKTQTNAPILPINGDPKIQKTLT